MKVELAASAIEAIFQSELRCNPTLAELRTAACETPTAEVAAAEGPRDVQLDATLRETNPVFDTASENEK